MKNRIKQLRKDKLNLSQQKFAKRINISQATVADYESGRITPPDRVIADICREFNANEDWLRTGEGPIFREMTEREIKIMKLENALKGKSDSLIHGLYCLADMEPEEIKLLIDFGFKIIELTANEEYIRRINKKL